MGDSMDTDDLPMDVEEGEDSDYEDVDGSDDDDDSGDTEDDSGEDEGILGDAGVSAKPKSKKDKLKKLGIEGKKGESSKVKAAKPKKAYLPGMQLKEGETLECDESAYITLHTFTTVAPCLSFDIIPDSLGPNRTKFPLTSYVIGGTQAQRSHANSLIIMKV